jgi:hypothetical protein
MAVRFIVGVALSVALSAHKHWEQYEANGSQCANALLLDDMLTAQQERMLITMLRIPFARSARAAVATRWWNSVSESFAVVETRSARVWLHHGSNRTAKAS